MNKGQEAEESKSISEELQVSITRRVQGEQLSIGIKDTWRLDQVGHASCKKK